MIITDSANQFLLISYDDPFLKSFLTICYIFKWSKDSQRYRRTTQNPCLGFRKCSWSSTEWSIRRCHRNHSNDHERTYHRGQRQAKTEKFRMDNWRHEQTKWSAEKNENDRVWWSSSKILETKQTNDRFVNSMKQFSQVSSATYSFNYLFYHSQKSAINYQKLHP